MTALTLIASLLTAGEVRAWGMSPEDRVRQVAAAMIFVPDNCPHFVVNRNLASGVIEANSYGVWQIGQEPLRKAILDTRVALSEEPERACYALWDTFGQKGTAVPGVLKRKPR